MVLSGVPLGDRGGQFLLHPHEQSVLLKRKGARLLGQSLVLQSGRNQSDVEGFGVIWSLPAD